MPHRVEAHRPQHRHPETARHARRPGAFHAVRALFRREAGPRPDVIDRLPLGVFEDKDSGGKAAQTTKLGYGAGETGHVYLDTFRPLADTDVTEGVLGLPGTKVVGIIRGDYIRPPYNDPERDAKERHLQALNTTYILEAKGHGLPHRCILFGFNVMQDIRQARARAPGEALALNEAEVQVITRGEGPQSVQLGKGKDNWIPYKWSRDKLTGDPHYLQTADERISKKQTLVGMDDNGRIWVADGSGRPEAPSKNGTVLVHGTAAEPSTTVIPAQQGRLYGAEPTALAHYTPVDVAYVAHPAPHTPANGPAFDPWADVARPTEYIEYYGHAMLPPIPGGDTGMLPPVGSHYK